MADRDAYLPFSQRNGYEPVPPQLKLGQVSRKLRRLIYYYICQEIDRNRRSGPSSSYFVSSWKIVAKDLHVIFFQQSPSTYNSSPFDLTQKLERFIQKANISQLFNLVEFFLQHTECSARLSTDLTEAFVTARAAYRIVDQKIIATSTEEQRSALEGALEKAEKVGVQAARTHLLAAGANLRGGDWAGSVRESISAVEAIVLVLDPKTKKFGEALSNLEKKGHLHRSLKSALGQLYGYTSDEKGVRHSLVFEKKAKVDEADALFMLGVCAAFVSYLIARSNQQLS